MKKDKTFNIIVAGVGGQGLITLIRIIAQAALAEGYEVRTSELHGLSQRGGSVETHLRFGKEVFSPLVFLAKADLIFGLELSEALRKSIYANSETIFLINQHQLSFPDSPSEKELIDKFKSLFKNLYLIPASKICQRELGLEVVSGIYLLGYGIFRGLIPLEPKSVLSAIRKIVPEKYFELNKKAFELAKK